MVFIDTSPLIDKYREDTEKYPDAGRQDMEEQLQWIEKTLASSAEKWKIVIGHHPVYADTPKEESERADMRKRLEPLLDRYGVDMYFCGHIHNFQHIQPADSKVDYLVNTSGSLSRKVKTVEGTKFCNPEAGFTVVSMEDSKLSFYLMNGKGKYCTSTAEQDNTIEKEHIYSLLVRKSPCISYARRFRTFPFDRKYE